jgi:hypothetical protein
MQGPLPPGLLDDMEHCLDDELGVALLDGVAAGCDYLLRASGVCERACSCRVRSIAAANAGRHVETGVRRAA